MANIKRRQIKSGSSYRVRYIDPDRVERSRSFRRRADAEDFAVSVEHSLRSGAYIDPTAARITVRQYLEDWRGQQAQHRPRTADNVRRRLATMVYPHFGALRLSEVKASTVRTWQAALLAAGYAPSNISAVRAIVAGAFGDAVLDRLLASNPFDGVPTVEIIKDRIVPRSIDQVRAGEAAITLPRYKAVIPVDAGTGLRASELFGLTVDRLDLLRRTLTVDRQLVGSRNRRPIFGPPKTKASARELPLSQMVVDRLAAHLARCPARPHELVFRTRLGSPVSSTAWANAWAPAQAAMGLDPGQGLHQLRHFYASLLIAEGCSVKEVQARLGHASAGETLDTYSHLWPGSEDRTRTAIDRAFSSPVDELEQHR